MPFSDSINLQKLHPKHSMVYLIENGGHNNLPTFAEYHEYLYDILNDDVLYQEVAGTKMTITT
jgi:hypothetical protein